MSTNKTHISNKLPAYKAPSDSWRKIAAQLDALEKTTNNTTLNKRLPSYQGPDVFNSITRQIKPRHNFSTFIKIAASIALFVSIGTGLLHWLELNSAELTHTIEDAVQGKPNENLNISKLETDLSILIAQQCKIKPEVCSKNEYHELQQQLNDIENELILLKKALSTYNDPNLENHLIRLANEKVKLETILLNLFSY